MRTVGSVNVAKMRHQSRRAIGYQHYRQRWMVGTNPGVGRWIDPVTLGACIAADARLFASVTATPWDPQP